MKKGLVIIVLLVTIWKVNGQTLPFNNILSKNLAINSSFLDDTTFRGIGSGYTYQSPNKQPFEAFYMYYGSYKIYLTRHQLLLGLAYNRENTATLHQREFIVPAAYVVPLGRNKFVYGVNAIIRQYSLKGKSKIAFDMDFGNQYKTRKYTFAISSHNVTAPSVKFDTTKFEKIREYYVQAGRRFVMYDDSLDRIDNITLWVNTMIYSDVANTAYLVNSTLTFQDKVRVGIGYKNDFSGKHLAMYNVGFTLFRKFEIDVTSYLPMGRGYFVENKNSFEVTSRYTLR